MSDVLGKTVAIIDIYKTKKHIVIIIREKYSHILIYKKFLLRSDFVLTCDLDLKLKKLNINV